MTNSQKKLTILAILLVALTTILLIVVPMLRPKLTVVFTGEHDPTSILVRAGDIVLEPVGKDGREFTAPVSGGNKKITVVGPLIETISEEVSAPLIGKKSIEIQTKAITPEMIVKNTLDQDQIIVDQVMVYEKIWLVAYVSGSTVPNSDGYSAYPILLYYDQSVAEWRNVSVEDVELIESAPKDARSKYEARSED